MQLKKFYGKGGRLYAAHVWEAVENETPRLEDFHVLQEFRDVFPDEILWLPQKRDIYFTIDLVPRAAPLSNTPYRMGTLELLELKMQLQELLEKKYIIPGVSPWEHQFCLWRRKMLHSGCVLITDNWTKSRWRINTLFLGLMTSLINERRKGIFQDWFKVLLPSGKNEGWRHS